MAPKKYLKVKQSAAQENTKSNERNWLDKHQTFFVSFFYHGREVEQVAKAADGLPFVDGVPADAVGRSVGQQRRT